MQNIYLAGQQIHSLASDLGFVIFSPIAGLEFPDVRLAKYDRPGEHGAIVQTQFYSGRNIVLNGRVSGNTVNQYLANRRILMSLVSIVLDSLNNAQPLLLKFLTLDSLSLQCQCYVPQKPTITEKSLNHASFIIPLFCPDPNLYDQSQQVSSLVIPSGGGAIYPVVYPVTYVAATGGTITVINGGSAGSFSYPIVTFNGPLTSPVLINQTTGQSFKVNLTLGSGDVLVVDMQNHTMLLNGTTNANQYYDSNNSWMSIVSGSNILSMSSDISADTGNITIAFRNSYLGI